MFSEPMPLDRKILDVSQGMARTFSKRIYDENGKSIIGFSGDEGLCARVGAGYNSQLLDINGLAAEWSVASEGQYQIQVPAVEIEQGIYTLQVILDPRGEPCYPDKREIFRGYLRVNPSPVTASGESLQTYCSYAEMLEEAPWLETVHTDRDMSGFFRQRLRARNWIDSAIMRCTSNSNPSHAIFYGVIPPYNASSSYVKELIEANKLVLAPEIRLAATHYAIYVVADRLASAPNSGSYKEIANAHFSKANSELQSAVAGFDENGSGSATFFVDLRLADGRITV